jgi:predicted Fe-S protein YdhL (DUF1289 family)
MVRRGRKERIDWSDIESPCIKVCKIINKVCIGCFRTDRQIRDWVIYTDKERTELIKEIQLDRCRVLSNN